MAATRRPAESTVSWFAERRRLPRHRRVGAPPLTTGGAALVLGLVALGIALGLIVAVSPLIAVALLIAAAVGYVVIARPQLMLLVMVAALPWENKLHYPSATFSAVKGIGALVMAAYMIRLLGHRGEKMRLTGLTAIVAALGTWVLLSLLTSPEPVSGFSQMVRWIMFLAFFFLITQLLVDRDDIRRALRWFTTSVGVAAVYGLWQFVTAHSEYRVSGPLQDPNEFGYLLACALPMAAYLIATDRPRRIPWAICFLTIAAATLGTFSRGAFVGLGVVVAWGIVTKRVPLWAVGTVLGTALVIVLMAFTVWKPLVDQALHQKTHIASKNVESREAFWRAALTLAERRPLTGVGPGRFPHEAANLLRNDPIVLKEPVTHNSYLEVLAENGLPALLLFLLYLVASSMLPRRAHKRSAGMNDVDGRRLATTLQASFIVAVVSGFFISAEFNSPYWLLGGLAVVLVRAHAVPAVGRRQVEGGGREMLSDPMALPT